MTWMSRDAAATHLGGNTEAVFEDQFLLGRLEAFADLRAAPRPGEAIGGPGCGGAHDIHRPPRAAGTSQRRVPSRGRPGVCPTGWPKVSRYLQPRFDGCRGPSFRHPEQANYAFGPNLLSHPNGIRSSRPCRVLLIGRRPKANAGRMHREPILCARRTNVTRVKTTNCSSAAAICVWGSLGGTRACECRCAWFSGCTWRSASPGLPCCQPTPR